MGVIAARKRRRLDQDRDPAETREWLDALDSVEAFEGSMFQINAAARLPLKVVHGVKTGTHHRSRRDRYGHFERGCTRLRSLFHLGDNVKAGVQGKRHSSSRSRRTSSLAESFET